MDMGKKLLHHEERQVVEEFAQSFPVSSLGSFQDKTGYSCERPGLIS